jgi:hypothetical protein
VTAGHEHGSEPAPIVAGVAVDELRAMVYRAASAAPRVALQVPFEALQVDARGAHRACVPAPASGIPLEGHKGPRQASRVAGVDFTSALPIATVEALARAAILPEFDALDYRRQLAQPMTEPELHAWRRIERFAALVATAVAGDDTDTSNSTPGAGPVAAL